MSDTLTAKKRSETGTLRMKRLRQAGQIPAILYGHGQDSISLSIKTSEVLTVIRHGSLLVELKGDVNESALIKDIQWDALGSDVLHLDLTRVDATERIEVTVPIETRGVAPGSQEGGVITQIVHEITMVCAANKLVDKLEININDLHLEQSLTLADIEMPEGAELQDELDTIIVTCTEPTAVPEDEEEDEEVATGAEPEVIGRPSEDEEGGEGDS